MKWRKIKETDPLMRLLYRDVYRVYWNSSNHCHHMSSQKKRVAVQTKHLLATPAAQRKLMEITRQTKGLNSLRVFQIVESEHCKKSFERLMKLIQGVQLMREQSSEGKELPAHINTPPVNTHSDHRQVSFLIQKQIQRRKETIWRTKRGHLKLKTV